MRIFSEQEVIIIVLLIFFLICCLTLNFYFPLKQPRQTPKEIYYITYLEWDKKLNKKEQEKLSNIKYRQDALMIAHNNLKVFLPDIETNEPVEYIFFDDNNESHAFLIRKEPLEDTR